MNQTQQAPKGLEQKLQTTLDQTAQNASQAIPAVETKTIPVLVFPEPTGAYSIGTTTLYFADPKREEIYTEDPNDYREITTKVWYPSEEVPGAPNALLSELRN